MNRRDSIRSLFLGSMAGGLALESCISAPEEVINEKYGNTNMVEHPKKQLEMKPY